MPYLNFAIPSHPPTSLYSSIP